jgi:hypothetical protein
VKDRFALVGEPITDRDARIPFPRQHDPVVLERSVERILIVQHKAVALHLRLLERTRTHM